ncbi:MAG: nucleotidyltransferase family protein [Bacteroidia bacterium]|nr:nucleotidyltransferase family protein [Bacteroidia bacterium]
MKALVFAAGLGTRLRPLTNDRPKALVELKGVPLLDRVVARLIAAGVDELVVNVHHFADKVIEHIAERDNFGLKVHISDERELLLETGGGLKFAAPYLQGTEPFFVHNADVVTDLDLAGLYAAHLQHAPLATLAVRQRPSSRFFLFDPKGLLCGWENVQTGEVKLVRGESRANLVQRAFSGVHVISPEIFALIRQEGKFSIVDTYLDLAGSQEIRWFEHNQGYWIDCGKPEELRKAEGLV